MTDVTKLLPHLGPEVVELAIELKKKKDYSEFKLAEKLKKEVNATRNLLYRLHNVNLASFIKKKDQKKGWYIYYWTLDLEKIAPYLLKEKKLQLEVLKEKKQKNSVGGRFACPNGCGILDFDRSCELSFKCPECGELLQQQGDDTNLEQLATLEKDIKKLEEKKAIKNAALESAQSLPPPVQS